MKREDYKNIRELKGHYGYSSFRNFMDADIESARMSLESAKDEDVYRLQGRLAAIRALAGMLDNIDEYIKCLEPENL